MANGADTEEYMALTHVRPGLKRELAFAIKSQSEYAGSIGRTRTRKFPSSNLVNDVMKDYNDNKRLKSSVLDNVNGLSKKLINNEDYFGDDGDMANYVSEEETKSDVVDSISDAQHKVVLVESCHNKDMVEFSIESPKVGFNAEPVLECGVERFEGLKSILMGKLEKKKIALKKIPTRLKELLETGLLDGLPVQYQRGLKTRGTLGDGLEGIISGSGIVCFCKQCDGFKVVSPNLFEVHAGSSNKRPPDYIYLENGKNLRDVLHVCKNAPLDDLEVFMQSVVGSSFAEKEVLCRKCKSSNAGGSEKEMLLCTSCEFINESQPSHVSIVYMKNSQLSPASTLDMEESESNPASICDMEHPRATPPMLDNKCRSRKTPCSKSSSRDISRGSQRKGKITRKDLGLHKLVFQNDILPDGTELAYYARGQKFLEGYKKGTGIFCFCCESEVSPSQFEAHAGFASRRKPYLNIYTSNGASLHELALRLSNLRKLTEKESDDLCSICADGGDLLCCDNCPRAFHRDCASLPCIPTGTWYCKYCQSMIEREKFVETNANAIAAGRVAGTDPLEEITKRCIRILGTLESDVGACALCRGHEFSNSGFGPQTVIICDQCEKEYHVGCLKENRLEDLKELPVGKWFCCKDCSRIHSALEEIVVTGDKCLPESLMGIIKTKLEEKGFEGGADLDITWRLLNGRREPEDIEESKMLSKAVAIFHDRFDPVADFHSGVRDLIPHMVFGKKVRYQDFGGMYCAVLKVNSEVVSAGIIRIFGEGVAELPLVATSTESQGQGYFQVLFSCMENLLLSLNVKKLVLPAADEAESLWTNKFGFNKIAKEEMMNYQKDHQMMVFQGTEMLQKLVVSS